MSVQEFLTKYPFTLDNFQLQAIEALKNFESVLVSAPTGSGKTLIAEFAIYDALINNKKVVYTTPLKALSNQKYRDFVLEYQQNKVGLITGDISINPYAPLVIMTTEILRNILYQDKTRLNNVKYLIIDECHYMNDEERGTVWEETIMLCPSHIQIVALSATVSNSKDIANWINSLGHKINLIESNIRPVPLYHYYYIKNRLIPIFNENKELNSKLYRYFNNGVYKKSNNIAQIYEESTKLLTKLLQRNMLPAIYFIFSRQMCETMLFNCINNNIVLTTDQEQKEIKNKIKQTLLQYPSLKDTSYITKSILDNLYRGVAVHHAGLVPVLRYLIEVLFQESLIKVVFATETLAAGINMPAKTTIISSLSKRSDYGIRTLTVNEFTQMSGRAGRRGKDTEGYCIVVYDGYQNLYDAYNIITGEQEPIQSHFSLSYNMVLNLLSNFDYSYIPTVLKLSFGQYLANKEIINLQMELKELISKLSKLEKKTKTASLNKKIKKLEKKIKSTEKLITKQQNIYVERFYSLINVLKYFEQIVEDNNSFLLTPQGQITANIRSQNDLLISLCLETPEVQQLNSIELAAFLSIFTYEPRREKKNTHYPVSKQLKQAYLKALLIMDQLDYIQEKNKIKMPISIEKEIIPIVIKWAEGCSWSELKDSNPSIDDGDLIRAFRQLIDLLHQIERIPTLSNEFILKVKDSIKRLDRDILQIVI